LPPSDFQPNCYLTYRFIIPTPIVLLDTGIYIAPDIATLFEPSGPNFTAFYEKKGFNWKRLAGARVRKIGGVPAWEYIDYISDNVVGIFLDHNVRMNSVLYYASICPPAAPWFPCFSKFLDGDESRILRCSREHNFKRARACQSSLCRLIYRCTIRK